MTKLLVDNKAVNASDTVVKFGLGQVGKTTPTWAKQLFRIVLYVATAVVITTQIITEIPEEIKVIVSKYAIEAVALVHAFSKLFGVDIKED